jgi:hypothetical protein
MSQFASQFPAQAQTADTRELLPFFFASGSDPITPEVAFYGQSLPGIRYMPHVDGGNAQFIFNSVMTPASAARPFSGKGQSAITARSNILMQRTDHYVRQTLRYSEKELENVPVALQRLAIDRSNAATKMWQVLDRRIACAWALLARQPSLTLTQDGVSLIAHQGGTVVTRSGSGNADPLAAVRAAYPPSPTGCSNAQADLESLVRQAQFKGIDLANAQVHMHWDFYNALRSGSTTNATLFSTDYVRGAVGNSTTDYKFERVAGVQVGKLLHMANYMGDNGVIPNANLTSGNNALFPSIPSVLRANFAPAASTGVPVAFIVGNNPNSADSPAVAVMEHRPMRWDMIDDPEEFMQGVQGSIDASIWPVNPACVATIEVTL